MLSSALRAIMRDGAQMGAYIIRSAAGPSADFEPLGAGMTSVVVLGEQTLIEGVSVRRAVKLQHIDPKIRNSLRDAGESTSGAGEFEQEIENLAAVSHENLVSIVDAGEENLDGQTVRYLVMELFQGMTLKTLLAGHPSALRDRTDLITSLVYQLIRPVEYLHSRNLYHRDIAPKNIFLRISETGESVNVKLGDLGVGLLHTGLEDADENVWIAGTKDYMPPALLERLGGKYDFLPRRELGEWLSKWDLYSLGKTIADILATQAVSSHLEPLRILSERLCAGLYDSAAQVMGVVERLRPEHLITVGVPELPSSGAVQRDRIVLPGGDLHLTRRLREVIDHPTFQRLRKIPQMQFASSAWPGATHMRYEHSLGCLRNMQSALVSITRDPISILEMNPEDYELALLASLLSSYHAIPLYHVICECRQHGADVGFLTTQGIASRQMDHQARTESMRHRIERLFPAVDPDILVKVLGGEEPSERYSFRLTHQLLDSSLDVRVVDYLFRDSLHTGVPFSFNLRASQLYPYLSFRESRKIVLDVELVPVVEQLLAAKFWMYEHVYWSPFNRAVVAMFTRLILEYASEHGAEQMQDFVWRLRENDLELEVPRKFHRASERQSFRAVEITRCLDMKVVAYEVVCELSPADLRKADIEPSSLTSNYLLLNGARALAKELNIDSAKVLLDIPPTLRPRNLGEELFVDRDGEEVRLFDSSRIAAALCEDAVARLAPLRVLVHPDHVNDRRWGELIHERLPGILHAMIKASENESRGSVQPATALGPLVASTA